MTDCTISPWFRFGSRDERELHSSKEFKLIFNVAMLLGKRSFFPSYKLLLLACRWTETIQDMINCRDLKPHLLCQLIFLVKQHPFFHLGLLLTFLASLKDSYVLKTKRTPSTAQCLSMPFSIWHSTLPAINAPNNSDSASFPTDPNFHGNFSWPISIWISLDCSAKWTIKDNARMLR